ncbi:MAG: 30S ribosome-binding factor RbfA [Candidatus Competibacteraceae bacterium]|jgi:ribosome-binding factor A|nr:30S ribosome-binding factor RbfA [Candidatus Competibacteraceae bacterium]MBK7984080.1 30S ribosome-binding factor RbfA [Candidatus Competibacteraceae bacterium]MBK8896057.1 30S ribosome-binding factor RbfA [Candidatus Competibacteraceae bacterium]MBK8963529.1 30S ribosome-binding factor RbfA [Candidatus Competibacteraceae bacterium]MBK9950421.1 30S ribosome-binding factor RbfA [Candidatus Competibacteraceae bacterium]
MKAFPRTRRIGEQIRRELAELIRDELRDPRLTLISMTSVEVSRDLAHARIYVTLMGDPAERAERVADLNHAAPLLRRELGRRMRIRTVPKLEFRYDEVVEHGARLSALIDAAVAADAGRHHDGSDAATDPAASEDPA